MFKGFIVFIRNVELLMAQLWSDVLLGAINDSHGTTNLDFCLTNQCPENYHHARSGECIRLKTSFLRQVKPFHHLINITAHSHIFGVINFIPSD